MQVVSATQAQGDTNAATQLMLTVPHSTTQNDTLRATQIDAG